MEGLLFILAIVFVIYTMGKSKGRKQGRHEGSQSGYAAGRASGAKNVYMNEKGGCLGIFLLFVCLTTLILGQFI